MEALQFLAHEESQVLFRRSKDWVETLRRMKLPTREPDARSLSRPLATPYSMIEYE
jgi:hypothetical protein